MHPVIILEGPDCVGKSTLGEYLKSHWGAELIHCAYRFRNRMFDYHWAVLEKALKISQERPVVIDRWWPSELIYADVFRGGSKWPMIGRMMDRVALKHGFIYVSCQPSDEQWQITKFNERAERGGELYDSTIRINQLYRLWHDRMSPRRDFTIYDVLTDGKHMSKFADSLQAQWNFIRRHIPHEFENPEFRRLAGQFHPHPAVLLVGEKSNPKGRHSVWPFFEHGYSSLFLTQQLANAHLKEEKITWINSIGVDGWASPELITRVYDTVMPHFIVALGAQASRVCSAAGVINHGHGYRYIPHPAYVTRFQNGDDREYQSLFKEIMESI